MKKYEHLFFDLDHTLWDFEANSNEALQELFVEHQLKEKLGVTYNEFFDTYKENNNKMWVLYRDGKIDKPTLRKRRFADTFASFELKDERFALSFDRQYMKTAPIKGKLVDGCIEILDYLKDHYHLHIITNGFADATQLKVRTSGIEPYFKLIMTSDELQVNKPHARIFVESMKRTGAGRKNSLMIGDNLQTDILGARNCGIDQVFYNPSQGEHSDTITHEVHHLKELLHLL